jgi:hypothetical protein
VREYAPGGEEISAPDGTDIPHAVLIIIAHLCSLLQLGKPTTAKEVTMETLLLIIGIIAVALFLFRPAPQPQIMLVPIEVASPQGGGLGCLLPMIVAIMLLLLLSGGLK